MRATTSGTPQHRGRAVARVALTGLLLAFAALLAACQGVGASAGGDGDALPDLPKATRVLTAGESVQYRNARLTVREITTPLSQGRRRAAPPKQIAYTLADDGETSEGMVEAGGFLRSGEVLIQVADRAAALPDEAPTVLATFYHLPRMTGTTMEPPFRRQVRPGDVLFLPGGGVLAVQDIEPNNTDRRDDDRVRLWLQERATAEPQTLTVPEFRALPLASGLLLSAGDVDPGELPGEALAEIALSDAPFPFGDQEEPVETTRLTLLSGVGDVAFGQKVTAMLLEGEDGALVSFRPESNTAAAAQLESGRPEASFLLSPGEAVRWGPYALRLEDVMEDGAAGPEAVVEFARYRSDRLPRGAIDVGRVAVDPELGEDRGPDLPTTVVREIAAGDSTEFWGARFQLIRVQENDPMNLFDDTVEVLVTDLEGNARSAVRLREKQSDTVHGNNRWWVVKVDSAQAHARPQNATARLELTTGQFFRVNEDAERPRYELPR